jgi:hypothetical protein
MSSFRISFLIYDNGNIGIELHTSSIFMFEFFTSMYNCCPKNYFLRGIFNIASLTMGNKKSSICAYDYVTILFGFMGWDLGKELGQAKMETELQR